MPPDPFREVARPWTLFPKRSETELEAPRRTHGVSDADPKMSPPISRLGVQLLHNRGIRGAEAVQEFLRGEWRARVPAMLDLDRAVTRIREAIQKGEYIVVFGDFDCDGVTSCALMTVALRALGAHVEPFVPTRDDDGRGLNSDKVRDLAAQGVKLVITTDCGTANVEEVKQAREQGIEVIVTDHHPAHGEMAPAYAVVNPQREADPSESAYLAGVGVAFRVAEALFATERAPHGGTVTGERDPSTLLDLVAVGTIGDVVPLTPVNWALARAGLERLNAAPRAGLRALIQRAGLTPGQITSRDISFALAPRLNAAGRLGQPMLAVRLLTTENDGEAAALAGQLDALNVERQEMTETVSAAARAQVLTQLDGTDARDITAQAMLVAEGYEWPLGILGLVAGRLTEEFRRPVFVLSRGAAETRGSARGPEGWSLGTALAARAELFTRFGGHAQAAGFTLPNERLEELRQYLRAGFALERSQAESGGEQEQELKQEQAPAEANEDAVRADVELFLGRKRADTFAANFADIFADVERLEPYGPGFVEPTFVTKNLRIEKVWRSGAGGRTLRLKLKSGGQSVIAFWPKHGDLVESLPAANQLPLVDIVYTLSKYRRSYDGETVWQMRVVTITPST